MAPGRVGVAKLLRTRSFPGGQRLPALLRREQRRHSLAPHCDPPQRRLHTGLIALRWAPIFGCARRALAWRAHGPLHFSSLQRRPLGSHDPPHTPLSRPICVRTGETPMLFDPRPALGPARSSAARRGGQRSQRTSRRRSPHPTRPPAPRRDWRVSLSVSLSPSNSSSLNRAVSVPVLSERLSAPPSRPDSFWHRTWSVCLFTCPLSTCLSLISACLTVPQAPSFDPTQLIFTSSQLTKHPSSPTPSVIQEPGEPARSETSGESLPPLDPPNPQFVPPGPEGPLGPKARMPHTGVLLTSFRFEFREELPGHEFVVSSLLQLQTLQLGEAMY